MIGRVSAIAALATFAGIALSVRDLVLPPPRQVPLPFEGLAILAWLFALAVVGWFAAQVIDGPLRFVAAPAAAALAIGVALAGKLVRYPDAGLVGDGFEVLIWIYAALGFVGAGIGSLSAMRPRSERRAAAITAGLILATGVLGALPYVLASA